MKTLGWILFVFNIIGLIFCIYTLQLKFSIAYLSATGLLIAQIVYIAKTLKVLQRFEITREMLESTAKKTGLNMTKILSGKKGDKEK
jgi:hypothetical protein